MQALQQQNSSLLAQMASAAKMLNAAIVENQILKEELSALGMVHQARGVRADTWRAAAPCTSHVAARRAVARTAGRTQPMHTPCSHACSC